MAIHGDALIKTKGADPAADLYLIVRALSLALGSHRANCFHSRKRIPSTNKTSFESLEASSLGWLMSTSKHGMVTSSNKHSYVCSHQLCVYHTDPVQVLERACTALPRSYKLWKRVSTAAFSSTEPSLTFCS